MDKDKFLPNEDEQKVLDALVEAWNAYLKIPKWLSSGIYVEDDTNDFRKAIHECQRIIATKILARNYPLFWKP